MEFKVKLLQTREEAKDTKTLVFERPDGFSYIAGQYIYLTLPHLSSPDLRGDTRQFTLSSSPTEKNLQITVRIRSTSPYKQTLGAMKLGDTLEMHGPNGEFVLDDRAATPEVAPQIFIAGGIGVTPFRSIIKYVTDTGSTTPIHLVCSNSIPEEIVFKEELENIVHSTQNIKIIHTITKPKESRVNWKGLVGRIDEKFLSGFLKSNLYPLTSVFWLCGPPPMVSAMEELLEKLGVKEENIRVEKFTGY